jgi:hypothetical protein
MKKMTIALGLMFTMAIGAQAQQKSILAYGGIDGGNGEYNLDLGIGYQFDQSLTAGINIMNQSDGYAGTSAPVKFMAGPFLRYTKPMTQLISLYGQADLSFGSGNSVSATSLNFTPGAQINIKNGLALTMNLGNISWYRTSSGSVSASNNYFNLGRGFMFGIQKNFGGNAGRK